MSTTLPRPRRGAKPTRVRTTKKRTSKKPRSRLSSAVKTSRLLNHVAGTIRRLRRKQSLSKAEAARRGEMALRTYERIEAGQLGNVKVGTLVNLGAAFGVDPAALLPKGRRSR